ncbi:MAG: response regulator transcription factor [Saprospiraceae bacterium]|nr:response regulator transcription factor [Saprospiraceae bacterium]
MTLLIVEDEPLHADRFEMLARQMGYEVAAICDNAFDALSCFSSMQPDLLLLDVQLRGEIDGIQLAEKVVRIRQVPIVFVTSMRDDQTFERARQIQPVAFILKPFDSLQLQRAIELAVEGLAKAVGHSESDLEHKGLMLTDCFFVKVREKLEKVSFSDILYLESDGHYSMLHTSNQRKYAIRIPLSELESRLPEGHFVRTHRSYVVQLSYLQSVDLQNMMVLLKDKSVPLSKGYRDGLLERLDMV